MASSGLSSSPSAASSRSKRGLVALALGTAALVVAFIVSTLGRRRTITGEEPEPDLARAIGTAAPDAARSGGRRASGVLGAITRRPALIAFGLALLGGLAIAVLTPPLAGGDERQHFTRAYQISQGDILTQRHGGTYGAYLPRTFATGLDSLMVASYYDKDRTAFLRELGDPAPHGPPTFVSPADAASYGPGSYVAAAAAIAAGRAMGLSVLGLLYLARIAGVLLYAGVLALAVQRLPVHRWTLVACGLIPAALNQASTVSADGVTLALSFLLVAEVVALAADPPPRVGRVLVEIGVTAGLLALAKPPYVAFVLLLLWPAWRYRGALRRGLLAIAGGALALAALWGSYEATHSISQGNPTRWLGGVGGKGYAFHHLALGRQTVYVVTHPYAFAAAIGRTFSHQGLAFPGQLFGQLALYQLPAWLVVTCIAVVVAAWIAPEDSDRHRLPGRFRALLCTLSVAIGLAVFAIAYTNWNAYRAPRIDAFPPRYLLPLLPALLIAWRPARPRPRPLGASAHRLLVAVGIASVLAIALVGLQHYHYSLPPPL